MPWYYAGPEAKPVGPVSLEELNARRVNGVITPETYIIEHSGQPGSAGEWRRYREVFPASSNLPPLPPVPPVGAVPPPAPVHSLFPSAAHAPTPQSYPPQVAAPHAFYPVRKTNACCAWGFGLGMAGFILAIFCIGGLLAAPGLVLCILGFVQVQRSHEQTGRGLAVAGAVLSCLGLLVSLGILAYAGTALMKAHEWTVTEQSSSNSE